MKKSKNFKKENHNSKLLDLFLKKSSEVYMLKAEQTTSFTKDAKAFGYLSY